MLLCLYGLYLFWWFRTIHDPKVELPQINGEVQRLVRYTKRAAIAFVVLLVATTSCDSVVSGMTASGDPGWTAASSVWQDFLTTLLWAVIIV